MDNTSLRSELNDNAFTLRRLLTYLICILQQSDKEQDMPNIAWDWEMFQEVMYPYHISSVYSGVLWYGLECLRASGFEGEDWKIIVPEGTRMELLEHLRQLTSKYTKRLRQIFPTEQRTEYLRKLENSISPTWKRQDWRAIFKEITALQHMERAVDRLLLLIQLYTRPSPIDSSSVSMNKVKYYQERLSCYRQEPPKTPRNIADAYNLATIESFEGKSNEGQLVENAFLITATTAVSLSGAHVTRDPIYFTLEMEMRRLYPDVNRRKKLILAALARISELLVRLGELPGEEGDSTESVGRQDTESFLNGLCNLYDDPVLSELGRLATRAIKAVENVASQAKQINTEVIQMVKLPGRLGRLNSFLKKVNMIFIGLGEKVEIEDYGLAWIKSGEYSNRYVMRAKDDHEIIMEAEKGDGLLTLCWKTEDSFPDFFESFKKLSNIVGFAGPVHVIAREYNQPGTKKETATKISAIPKVIRNVIGSVKISFLRLNVDKFLLWYEFGELIESDYTRNSLNLSRIAVRFPVKTDINLIANFFDETSANWYPSIVIANALDVLRYKM